MRKLKQIMKQLQLERELVEEAIYALGRLGPRHRGRPHGTRRLRSPRRPKR